MKIKGILSNAELVTIVEDGFSDGDYDDSNFWSDDDWVVSDRGNSEMDDAKNWNIEAAIL